MKFYQKLDGATHISAREYDSARDRSSSWSTASSSPRR